MEWESGSDSAMSQLQAGRALVPLSQQPAQGHATSSVGDGGTPLGGSGGGDGGTPLGGSGGGDGGTPLGGSGGGEGGTPNEGINGGGGGRPPEGRSGRGGGMPPGGSDGGTQPQPSAWELMMMQVYFKVVSAKRGQ